MLTLIEGPAGAGKSDLASALLESGTVEVLADITGIWVALAGVVRGVDGRYPIRLDDDPALQVARYLQRVAVRFAIQEGYSVAVTTSTRNRVEHWRQLAEEAGVPFDLRTVDPGRAEVVRRLSDADGNLSDPCAKAIGRWYNA